MEPTITTTDPIYAKVSDTVFTKTYTQTTITTEDIVETIDTSTLDKAVQEIDTGIQQAKDGAQSRVNFLESEKKKAEIAAQEAKDVIATLPDPKPVEPLTP